LKISFSIIAVVILLTTAFVGMAEAATTYDFILNSEDIAGNPLQLKAEEALSDFLATNNQTNAILGNISKEINIDGLEVISLNWVDISKRAMAGVSIILNTSEYEVSFKLRPADIGLESAEFSGYWTPDQIEKIRNTHAFRGYDMNGISELVATASDDFVYLSFLMNSKTIIIEPISGWCNLGDDSGECYYLTYSSDDVIHFQTIDFMNDTLPVFESEAGNDLSILDGVMDDNLSVEGLSIENEMILGEDEIAYTSSLESQQIKKDTGLKEAKENKSSCKGSDPEYRIARIVLAAEYDTYRFHPDWATTAINSLNTISAEYESQVGVTFKIVQFHQIPSEHPLGFWHIYMLENFEEYMESHTIEPRDIAHLCTWQDIGYRIGHIWHFETLGIANEGGVGSDRAREDNDNKAYSISEQWHSAYKNAWVMGHEIGHTLNGDHEFATSSKWMYSSYSGQPMDFSTNNVNRLKAYANEVLDWSKSINPGPSFIAPNKLQASNVVLEANTFYHKVSTSMTVYFSLTNTGTSTVSLQYVFVGARDASDNNRDFGYEYNIVIAPGATYYYTAHSFTPTSGGTWTFWPAYKIYGGYWGPYKWITVEPTMYYVIAYQTGPSAPANYYYPGVVFYKFYIFSTTSTLTVGSTVTAYFTLFNGLSGTSTNTFNSIFVGCRRNGAWRDFGWQGSQTLTQIADSTLVNLGGGHTLFASRTIDGSGSWLFWPTYQYNGHWGPYRMPIYITV